MSMNTHAARPGSLFLTRTDRVLCPAHRTNTDTLHPVSQASVRTVSRTLAHHAQSLSAGTPALPPSLANHRTKRPALRSPPYGARLGPAGVAAPRPQATSLSAPAALAPAPAPSAPCLSPPGPLPAVKLQLQQRLGPLRMAVQAPHGGCGGSWRPRRPGPRPGREPPTPARGGRIPGPRPDPQPGDLITRHAIAWATTSAY